VICLMFVDAVMRLRMSRWLGTLAPLGSVGVTDSVLLPASR
jgi:hypothetical protein